MSKQNFFYSKNDKTAFFIRGYHQYHECEGNVAEIQKMLKEGAKNIATILGVDPKIVKTTYINKSSRYKGMRAFYVDNVEMMPEGAFELGLDWTMSKWLSN